MILVVSIDTSANASKLMVSILIKILKTKIIYRLCKQFLFL